MEFGWTGPFLVRGREVALRRNLRYDHPYLRAPRFAQRLELNCHDRGLILDFAGQERIIRE